jgi:hypothetical protein
VLLLLCGNMPGIRCCCVLLAVVIRSAFSRISSGPYPRSAERISPPSAGCGRGTVVPEALLPSVSPPVWEMIKPPFSRAACRATTSRHIPPSPLSKTYLSLHNVKSRQQQSVMENIPLHTVRRMTPYDQNLYDQEKRGYGYMS